MVFGSKYDWDRWTNGQAWRVEQNVDFNCYGRSFVGNVYRVAKMQKQAAVTSAFEYPNGNDIVFFWFYDGGLWKPNFKAFSEWREEQRKHVRLTTPR